LNGAIVVSVLQIFISSVLLL